MINVVCLMTFIQTAIMINIYIQCNEHERRTEISHSHKVFVNLNTLWDFSFLLVIFSLCVHLIMCSRTNMRWTQYENLFIILIVCSYCISWCVLKNNMWRTQYENLFIILIVCSYCISWCVLKNNIWRELFF